MVTPLTKRVVRRGQKMHRGRRFVVMLEPGDVLGIRPERTRTTFFTSLEAVYSVAVKQAVAAQKQAKAAERAARRKRR